MKIISRLVLSLVVAGAIGGCKTDVLGAGDPSNPLGESFAPSLNVNLSTFERKESGVFYRDFRVGTGEVAAEGDQVSITYAGYLKDGILFDSRNIPTQFSLAVFIPGFRDGVVGMKVGGVRKLVIPSELAYSWRGLPDAKPPIPRNATLVFDVELFGVTKPPTTTNSR